MPPKRRLVPDATPSSTTAGAGPAKRPRGAGAISVGASRQGPSATIKQDPGDESGALRQEFIDIFSEPLHQTSGVSNGALKAKFGEQRYILLAPIINDLTRQSRLTMSRVGPELYYHLVSDAVASKFAGLDVQARMVYQVVEKSGNMGIWTREIRTQTNIQQQALNKIFKVKACLRKCSSIIFHTLFCCCSTVKLKILAC
jgi:hypothetical protein